MNFFISLISKGATFTLLTLLFVFDLTAQNDSDIVYRIRSIILTGNKKTKDRIILRELTFRTGDTLNLRDLHKEKLRSEQNIFNTQLFIYDSIRVHVDAANRKTDVIIELRERWYIWPIPVLEVQDRNFNTWWATKDLFRINYGFALGMENFTGVKDRFVLLFQRGYSEKYGFSYRIPYINKKQTLGVNFLYVYGRNNEVTYTTFNNEPLFVRDYKNYLRTEHEGKAGIIYRNNLYEQTTLEVLIRNANVGDTVLKLNPEFLGKKRRSITYGSLQYRYTYDNRDNRVYPLQGWAFDLWVTKDGFEYTQHSPVDLLHLTAGLRKHTKFHDRIYLSNLIRGRLMNTDKVPFYFNRALGYAENVRGYEYYVIEGQRYFVTTNSLRFQIMKPKVFQSALFRNIRQFSSIPLYAFINVFGDAGYVEDKFYFQNNSLTNSWQYGYGISLDVISYYDLVMRFEYSINRQKQAGFYIHLTSGF